MSDYIDTLNCDVLSEIFGHIGQSSYYALRHTNKYLSAAVRRYFVNNLRQKWFDSSPRGCIAEPLRNCHVDLVDWLSEYRGFYLPLNSCSIPRGENAVQMLKWLELKGHSPTADNLYEHISYGNVATAEYLFNRIPRELINDGDLLDNASWSKTVEMLEFVVEHTANDSSGDYRGYHFANIIQLFDDESDPRLTLMVDWMIDHCYELGPSAVSAAVENGFFNLAKKLFAKWDDPHVIAAMVGLTIAKYAVKHNNVEVFEQMHKLHIVPVDVCGGANTIEMITRLKALGYYPTEQTLIKNIEQKNTEVVEYLLREGCPVSPAVCDAAASVGDLALLKRLHCIGVDLVDMTGDVIYKGYLDVFQWIVEIAGKVDRSTIKTIIYNDALEILKWVVSRGYHELALKDSHRAIRHNSIKIVRWMEQLGCIEQPSCIDWREKDVINSLDAGIDVLEMYLKNLPGKINKRLLAAAVAEGIPVVSCILRNTRRDTPVNIPDHLLVYRHLYAGPQTS